MLDSFYHMTLKIILKSYFWRENVSVLPYISDIKSITRKSVNQ